MSIFTCCRYLLWNWLIKPSPGQWEHITSPKSQPCITSLESVDPLHVICLEILSEPLANDSDTTIALGLISGGTDIYSILSLDDGLSKLIFPLESHQWLSWRIWEAFRYLLRCRNSTGQWLFWMCQNCTMESGREQFVWNRWDWIDAAGLHLED